MAFRPLQLRKTLKYCPGLVDHYKGQLHRLYTRRSLLLTAPLPSRYSIVRHYWYVSLRTESWVQVSLFSDIDMVQPNIAIPQWIDASPLMLRGARRTDVRNEGVVRRFFLVECAKITGLLSEMLCSGGKHRCCIFGSLGHNTVYLYRCKSSERNSD